MIRRARRAVSRERLAAIGASPLAIATIRNYGWGLLIYGLVVILQGPDRWSGPQFVTTTNVADPWVWGTTFAILGLMILAGHYNYWFVVRNVGLYLGGVLLLSLGITIFGEALRNPHVSFAGIVICTILAIAMFIVARAKEEKPADAGLTQGP